MMFLLMMRIIMMTYISDTLKKSLFQMNKQAAKENNNAKKT